MALVTKKLIHGYYWLFEEIADPRANDYILSSSVIYPISLIGGYLYFVNKCGPDFMKNRKPFKIRNIIIIYNVIQVILNSYFTLLCLHTLLHFNWDCQPIDYSNSPESQLELYITRFYMNLKIFDLLDTVFFTLRKSYRQVSFLHVYHHCGILGGSWVSARFMPGGHGIWFGFLNGLVHSVMYAYYLLTALDGKFKKNIGFKRFITQMQLVQFGLGIFIYGRLIFKPECTYPKIMSYLFVPQNVLMLFMFGDFYVKNYMIKKDTSTKVSKQE